MVSERYVIQLYNQAIAAFDYVKDRRDPAYARTHEIDESYRPRFR